MKAILPNWKSCARISATAVFTLLCCFLGSGQVDTSLNRVLGGEYSIASVTRLTATTYEIAGAFSNPDPYWPSDSVAAGDYVIDGNCRPYQIYQILSNASGVVEARVVGSTVEPILSSGALARVKGSSDLYALVNHLPSTVYSCLLEDLIYKLSTEYPTFSYVDSLASDFLQLDVNRPISRNLGTAEGKNLGSSGETLSRFFEKFFFPVTPPSVDLSPATDSVFAYSVHSLWTLSDSVSFNYTVTNESYGDSTTDTPIDSLGFAIQDTLIRNISATGGDQSGTTKGFIMSSTPTSGYSKFFFFAARDTFGNISVDSVEITLSAAIPLSYGNPSTSPSVYELLGRDTAIDISWSITANDEAVVSISVKDTVTGSTALSGSAARYLIAPSNGGAATQPFNLTVTGDLYGAGTTRIVNVSWQHRVYRGIVPDGFSAFTDSYVVGNNLETALQNSWVSGESFAIPNDQDYNVYFCIPSEVSYSDIEVFVDLTGQWTALQPSEYDEYAISDFAHSNGYSLKDYKVIVARIPYRNGSVQYRIN